MLVNYAYYDRRVHGQRRHHLAGRRQDATIASMRGFMQPYTIVRRGPRGGLKKTSVVEVWMTHPLRAHIDAVQCRSDKPRPTFEEDGLIVYNRYWPPAHPATGGEIETFKSFFARLFPDEAERKWFWHWLAHKARRPWVPMVALIMVAEEFGTGRGTLFDILEPAVRQGLRRAVHIRRADGNVGLGRASTPGWPTRCSSWSTKRSPRTVTSRRGAACTTTR